MKLRLGKGFVLLCLLVAGTAGLRAKWQPGLKVGTVSGQANWTDWPAVTNTTLRLDAAETLEIGNDYSF